MSLARLLPPLGWTLSTIVAVGTGLALQEDDLPEPEEFFLSAQATEGSYTAASLSLPAVSDAERALEVFSARPLLAEGRRPFVPPEPPARADPIEPEAPAPAPAPLADDPPPPPTLTLLGSIEKSDGLRALLRDESTGLESWLAPGESVLGWTVVDVQPERVTLQLQGAEITLHLFPNALP
jgi:hypothetical protein